MAEFCYKVLYLMCANRDLSTPTLRYLRNNHEYFYSQLVHLPLNSDLLPGDDMDEGEEEGGSVVAMETTSDFKRLSLMRQQAWVLKSVAIELRMTSLSHQWSHTQRIVTLLLSGPGSDAADTASGGEGVDIAMGGARLKSDFDFLQEGRRKVLVLLDQVDFADKAAPSLEPLEYPLLSAIEQVVHACEEKVCVCEEMFNGGRNSLQVHKDYSYRNQLIVNFLYIACAHCTTEHVQSGQGSGPILWDDVRCTGSEQCLSECLHINHTGACIHTEDVGVTCQPLPEGEAVTTEYCQCDWRRSFINAAVHHTHIVLCIPVHGHYTVYC